MYEPEENVCRQILHSEPVMFVQNEGANQPVNICRSKLLMEYQVSPRSWKVSVSITNLTERSSLALRMLNCCQLHWEDI